MPNRAWPVDAISGAPAYTGRQLRQALMAPLSGGASAARPLGGRSGVRPGTPASTVTVAGSTWTSKPFAGLLDVQAAAEAGVYGFAVDTTTGTVATADQSNPRTDIIYVQLDDPAEGDGTTAPGVTVKYLAGSPAPTPSEPTPPTTRSMVVAAINVPKAGGGSPSVTWRPPYAVAAGGIIPVRDTADRATLTALATATNPVYVHRFDAPSGARLEVCDDGTNWRTHGFAPAVAARSRPAQADVGRGAWFSLAELATPFQFVKDGWYEINGSGQANIQGAAGMLLHRLRAFGVDVSTELRIPGAADELLTPVSSYTFKSSFTTTALVAHEVYIDATGSTVGIRCYAGSHVSVKRVG